MSGLYDSAGNPTPTFYTLKAYQLRAAVATELGAHVNLVDISTDVVMPIFKASGNVGVMDYFRKEAKVDAVPVETGRPYGWPAPKEDGKPATAAEPPPSSNIAALAAQHGWAELGYTARGWTALDEAKFKTWYPAAVKSSSKTAAFRIICVHNAGSAANIFTGKPAVNPFVKFAKEKNGELLAVELPGREMRHKEARYREPQAAAKAILPVLAPVLGEPYILVGHSVGTWVLFEVMKLLAEKALPLPKQMVLSSFPSPDTPVDKRPWQANKKMSDADFIAKECKNWEVNEVVYDAANWKTFAPMLRDDFALFDEYVYAPPNAGAFDVPIRAYYATEDKKVKEHHVAGWKRFTTKAFELSPVQGAKHLFFYDTADRTKFMNDVLAHLPAGFA